jgi:Ca-activated chloride channel family protein
MSFPENDSNGRLDPVARFDVTTDRALGRATARSRRFVRLSVQAAPTPLTRHRVPIAIAFALDTSGSMGGEKLELAKRALMAAVEKLHPEDAFSITTFDQTARLVLPLVRNDLGGVAAARRVLAEVGANGNTALFDGWRQARDTLPPVRGLMETLPRVVLLTDGQANVGPSTLEHIGPMVSAARMQGVTTTTLGIGADFNETLLAGLAAAGGGQFYYVPDADRLESILTLELAEAASVIAQGVYFELCPAPGVFLEPWNTYPAQWTGTALRIDVGPLVGGQSLDLIVAARLPLGAVGAQPSVEVTLGDHEGPLELPVRTVTWTLAGHPENDAQPVDAAVLRLVGQAAAAHARLEAVEHNRRGATGEAVAALAKASRYVGSLLPGDPEAAALAAALDADRAEFSHRMDEHRLKARHMASSTVLTDKSPDGRSRRGP